MGYIFFSNIQQPVFLCFFFTQTFFCACFLVDFRILDAISSTSIAARGGGGSFKREEIYNSEEQVPIEFVRVTCFNNAHFEEPFFSTCADRKTAHQQIIQNIPGWLIETGRHIALQCVCLSQSDIPAFLS